MWDPIFYIFKLIITLIGNAFLCCCCCCGCCCWCLIRNAKAIEEFNRQLQLRNRQQPNQFQPVPQQSTPNSNSDQQANRALNANALSDELWRKAGYFKEEFKKGCSVCLQEDPTVELQCGHLFHRKCITDSISQKH